MHSVLWRNTSTDEFCHHGLRLPSLSYSRPDRQRDRRSCSKDGSDGQSEVKFTIRHAVKVQFEHVLTHLIGLLASYNKSDHCAHQRILLPKTEQQTYFIWTLQVTSIISLYECFMKAKREVAPFSLLSCELDLSLLHFVWWEEKKKKFSVLKM